MSGTETKAVADLDPGALPELLREAKAAVEALIVADRSLHSDFARSMARKAIHALRGAITRVEIDLENLRD